MPHKPDTPCSVCGTLMWSGKGSRPPETRVCQPCRAARRPVQPGQVKPSGRPRPRPIACPCGTTVIRTRKQTYCSQACVARFAGNGRKPSGLFNEATRRGRRYAREARAPGLRPKQRSRLLAKWKRQGRTCWACSRTADTVDHMVPLHRGGTNHEGNLAPACRSCNARRGTRLIVEWRHLQRARVAA